MSKRMKRLAVLLIAVMLASVSHVGQLSLSAEERIDSGNPPAEEALLSLSGDTEAALLPDTEETADYSDVPSVPEDQSDAGDAAAEENSDFAEASADNLPSRENDPEDISDDAPVLEDDEMEAVTAADPSEIEQETAVRAASLRQGRAINSFDTLKAAIEDPAREEEIIVPGGDYLFTDTITVSKPLVLKNAAGEGVNFLFGLPNDNASSLGKTMMDIIADGALTLNPDSDASFVFDGQSQETNTSDKGVFITVRSDASLTVNHGLFRNSINAGMQTAPIYVDGGSFTLNDGVIENNQISHVETISNWRLTSREHVAHGYAKSAAVAVRNAGSFVMNGGAIRNNATVDNPNLAGSHLPTGIAVQNGTVVINGGTLSGNATLTQGGALYAAPRSQVTINDGEFSNNMARDGGALFFDWASTGTINGGTFTGNSADGMGGAAAITDRYMVGDENGSAMVNPSFSGYTHEQWEAIGLGVKLTVNGGDFTENQAFAGGAFYVSSNNTVINAANISNNTATRFGGGIYLSCVPYVLQLRNVYIDANTADDSLDQYISMSDGSGGTIGMPAGSGGGVWYCPTGDSEIYVSNGVAFNTNSATHDGDDFTSVTKKDANYEITLFERMLGGGLVSWYRDGDSQSDAVPRYDGSGDPISPIAGSSDSFSLKAVAGEDAFTAARELAMVIMSGNTAGRGGAIGTNGTVIFGDPDKEFSVTVTKTWDEKLAADAQPVEIALYVVLGETERQIQKATLTADSGWQFTFPNLPLEARNESIHYRVKELGSGGYDVVYENNDFSTANLTANQDVAVGITNKWISTSIPVTKFWDDNEDQDGLRPESVTVWLLADGEDTGERLVLSEANSWTDTFSDVAVYKGSEKITYSVTEDPVEGYTPAVEGDAIEGFRLTNSHVPELIDISVTKTWDDHDDQDGLRPESVTVRLLADGEDTDESRVLSDANNWTDTFTALDAYRDGTKIDYTIEEDPVGGYTPAVDGDAEQGFRLTNLHVPELIDIPVTKVWNDNDDPERPETITVQLLVDDVESDTAIELKATDNWQGAFTGLPKYRNGVELVYTVREVIAAGRYDVEISGSSDTGFTITNTPVPEETTATTETEETTTEPSETPPVEPTSPETSSEVPKTGRNDGPYWLGLLLPLFGLVLILRRRRSFE